MVVTELTWNDDASTAVQIYGADVDIMPGFSGGPIIDADGAVIGIATKNVNEPHALEVSGYKNIAFVTPIERIFPLLARHQIKIDDAKDVKPPKNNSDTYGIVGVYCHIPSSSEE